MICTCGAYKWDGRLWRPFYMREGNGYYQTTCRRCGDTLNADGRVTRAKAENGVDTVNPPMVY